MHSIYTYRSEIPSTAGVSIIAPGRPLKFMQYWKRNPIIKAVVGLNLYDIRLGALITPKLNFSNSGSGWENAEGPTALSLACTAGLSQLFSAVTNFSNTIQTHFMQRNDEYICMHEIYCYMNLVYSVRM